MSRAWTVAGLLTLSLLWGATPQALAAEKLDETGDQAKVEIAKGFFIDSEVGLLTFLFGDGAKVYRPGAMVGFRVGGDLGRDFALYGKIAGSVVGNTPCYSDPRGGTCDLPADLDQRKNHPRQGISVLAGLGFRWIPLRLDERFLFNISLEVLGQMIPPDFIPSANKEGPYSQKEFAFGGAAGLGIGFEYYFILKHFSFTADARFYYFFTFFFPQSMLGAALTVSVSLKYTF